MQRNIFYCHEFWSFWIENYNVFLKVKKLYFFELYSVYVFFIYNHNHNLIKSPDNIENLIKMYCSF